MNAANGSTSTGWPASAGPSVVLNASTKTFSLKPGGKRRVDEPRWFYDLDPLVRDLLAQNGDVPLLAVQKLRGRGRTNVSASFELDLTKPNADKPWVELDIAAIINGRVVVGEAKSNDTLKTPEKSLEKAAKRLVAAADALTADTLVLATSQPAWAPGVEPAVRTALAQLDPRRPRPALTILTGVT